MNLEESVGILPGYELWLEATTTYQAGSCRVSRHLCIVFSELSWEGLFGCVLYRPKWCCPRICALLQLPGELPQNTRKQELCQGLHAESVQVQSGQS